MKQYTYAIGDIHGMLPHLTIAVKMIEDHVQKNQVAEHKIICLGDYIDRGPDSKGVIDFLMERPHIKCLYGNHEDMVLTNYNRQKCDVKFFGMDNPAYPFYDDECALSFNGHIPEEYLKWMEELPLFYEDDFRFYVHAGVNPEYPLEDQRSYDMIWIRNNFLNSTKMMDRHIVHGHSICREPELLPNRTNLDTGCFHYGQLTIGVFDDNKEGGPIEILAVNIFDENFEKLFGKKVV